ncbi:MAG: hypothetical protein AAF689_01495 [Pseudomonadota bacterium]
MAPQRVYIKTRDRLIMTMTATLSGAIGLLANFAFFVCDGRNNRFPSSAFY